MSGIKGRSGRKSWDKELEAKNLWDLSVPVLKHALNSNEIPFLKKVEVAQFLVGKMLPQEFKGDGLLKFAIQVINYNGQNNSPETRVSTSRLATENT